MTENEAIKMLEIQKPVYGCKEYQKPLMYAYEMAIKALEEVEQYHTIGTPEELQKAEKEENILKFYYCDSEDSYLIGIRVGNFYYAHYLDGSWVFDMSRYLPWGEHVKQESTAWKEHTYPSEPREINFSEWLKGFVKKECGGTPEECRAAVGKQKPFKPETVGLTIGIGSCQCGVEFLSKTNYCGNCGQKLNWNRRANDGKID